MPALAFAELVSLDVRVSDLDGRPIEKAEGNMATRKKRMLPYENVGTKSSLLKQVTTAFCLNISSVGMVAALNSISSASP